jgi:3-deoxy-D-manno-octulosonic-acid transferase
MWWYNLGIYIYGGVVKAVSRFNPKARLWVGGRRNIFDRLREALSPGEPNGSPGKPAASPNGAGKYAGERAGSSDSRVESPGERIVWIHCASLGEFEQGRPVIEAIRGEHPEYKILLTFFSPSGYEIRKDYQGADYVFYLPLDTPRNVGRFLDTVRPEITIFVKYEYWLNYLSELRRRRCRVFIVSAIFRPDQIFFKRRGRAFRRALAAYEHIFVQNGESRDLLAGIGVTNVTVAGDTRFDRVARIAESARELPLIERFAAGQSLFVAGSTWEPDERILQRLVNAHPELKFIVAPHEMEISRITSLSEHTAGGAARYTELDADSDPSGKHLLIIDTIGILSSIYRYASYAYIGGGFGAGIHNTLEAATFGLPIAFGPNYHKFKEACDLTESGAAVSISNFEELDAWLVRLRTDKQLYKSLRRTAAGYVADHKGATETIVKTIFGENAK